MSARAARLTAAAVLVAVGSTGCANGLFQTAKTVPPGDVQAGLGVTRVFTDRQAAATGDAESGTPAPPPSLQGYTMPEAGLRVGLPQQTDVGLGSYLGVGLRADVKHNLVPDAKPYALAPRVGVGAASTGDESWLWAWLAGLVASYDLHRVVSVYAGSTFVAHYIHKPAPDVPPGERLAGRTPWGDGLLQLALGVELRVSSRVAFQGEYGHWFPLQNDPGDGYRFVPAHVLGARVVFGTNSP